VTYAYCDAANVHDNLSRAQPYMRVGL